MKRWPKDSLAYIFIALAIFIIFRAFTGAPAYSHSLAQLLLYLSIAISLLASNVPRVVDIPIHYVHAIKTVEYFSFCVAVICFLVVCVHYFIF